VESFEHFLEIVEVVGVVIEHVVADHELLVEFRDGLEVYLVLLDLCFFAMGDHFVVLDVVVVDHESDDIGYELATIGVQQNADVHVDVVLQTVEELSGIVVEDPAVVVKFPAFDDFIENKDLIMVLEIKLDDEVVVLAVDQHHILRLADSHYEAEWFDRVLDVFLEFFLVEDIRLIEFHPIRQEILLRDVHCEFGVISEILLLEVIDAAGKQEEQLAAASLVLGIGVDLRVGDSL
jgi:hypothetical protein